jgi:hypothetical protein
MSHFMKLVTQKETEPKSIATIRKANFLDTNCNFPEINYGN